MEEKNIHVKIMIIKIFKYLEEILPYQNDCPDACWILEAVLDNYSMVTDIYLWFYICLHSHTDKKKILTAVSIL